MSLFLKCTEFYPVRYQKYTLNIFEHVLCTSTWNKIQMEKAEQTDRMPFYGYRQVSARGWEKNFWLISSDQGRLGSPPLPTSSLQIYLLTISKQENCIWVLLKFFKKWKSENKSFLECCKLCLKKIPAQLHCTPQTHTRQYWMSAVLGNVSKIIRNLRVCRQRF